MDPVQHQLDAYNARDLEAFMEAYTPDVRVEDGEGNELMDGAEAMRAFYGDLFEKSSDLHCEVVDRTRVGNWVIDEEQVEGIVADGFPEKAHAVVAYRVSDGRVDFVRMFV